MELIAALESQSIQAESYRSIRTTLLVSSPPGKIKTILFTSPLAKEGKSSTVSNLGITLAEASKRVVIVDSDLRKPKQARIFGISSGNGPGLSRYLSSHIEPDEIVKPTEIANLYLITSGPLPANPIELLTSEKMDALIAFLKRSFDFVLLDTPPLLAVSDAAGYGPDSRRDHPRRQRGANSHTSHQASQAEARRPQAEMLGGHLERRRSHRTRQLLYQAVLFLFSI